jgi:bacillithiol system protein YtxJ
MTDVNELRTGADLDAMLQASHEEPVLLLKHSLTCPVSARGLRVFGEVGHAAPRYLVVVQRARDVSNRIASETGVRHESPQAMVLFRGRAVYHASHYDIDPDALRDAVATSGVGGRV